MIVQYVLPNRMSCLFDRLKGGEPLPEPFRLQGSVAFRVTYSEYINYILSLPKDSLVVLSTDLVTLRNLASTKSPKLYQYFLKDVAFAISKELVYAEVFGEDASYILPTSSIGATKVQTLTTENCEQLSTITQSLERQLIDEVAKSGYVLKRPKSQHNLTLYNVALVCYYMSTTSIGDEVNISI